MPRALLDECEGVGHHGDQRYQIPVLLGPNREPAHKARQGNANLIAGGIPEPVAGPVVVVVQPYYTVSGDATHRSEDGKRSPAKDRSWKRNVKTNDGHRTPRMFPTERVFATSQQDCTAAGWTGRRVPWQAVTASAGRDSTLGTALRPNQAHSHETTDTPSRGVHRRKKPRWSMACCGN